MQVPKLLILGVMRTVQLCHFHCINLTFSGLENSATLVQHERKCDADKHFISFDGIPD